MSATFAERVATTRENYILDLLADGPANAALLEQRLNNAGFVTGHEQLQGVLVDLEARGAVSLQRFGGVVVAELRRPETSTVASTSDARVVNNVMRHAYRVLSEGEKAQMQALKDGGLVFVELLHSVGGTDAAGDRQGSRELEIAQTKIEEAVMWAVKHVTR